MTTSGGSLTDPAFHDITLRPRRARRHVTALVVLLLLGAGLRTGYVAWRDHSWTIAIFAGALLVLAAVVWTAWATSPIAMLRVQGGVLHVTRAGRTDHFNLASPYTGVTVVSKPGRPQWEVRFARAERTPYVVDSSMVDPRAFMRVLEAYRSPLAAGHHEVPMPRQESTRPVESTVESPVDSPVEASVVAAALPEATRTPRADVVEAHVPAPAAPVESAAATEATEVVVDVVPAAPEVAEDAEPPAPRRSHRARVSRITVVTNRALRRR